MVQQFGGLPSWLGGAPAPPDSCGGLPPSALDSTSSSAGESLSIASVGCASLPAPVLPEAPPEWPNQILGSLIAQHCSETPARLRGLHIVGKGSRVAAPCRLQVATVQRVPPSISDSRNPRSASAVPEVDSISHSMSQPPPAEVRVVLPEVEPSPPERSDYLPSLPQAEGGLSESETRLLAEKVSSQTKLLDEMQQAVQEWFEQMHRSLETSCRKVEQEVQRRGDSMDERLDNLMLLVQRDLADKRSGSATSDESTDNETSSVLEGDLANSASSAALQPAETSACGQTSSMLASEARSETPLSQRDPCRLAAVSARPRTSTASSDGLIDPMRSTATGARFTERRLSSLDARERSSKDDRTCCHESVQAIFPYLSAALILSNAFFMGLQEEIRMQKALNHHHEPGWMDIVDTMFACLFLLEFGLRVWLYRWDILSSESRYWNLFDMLVVVTAFAEILSSALSMPYTYLLRSVRVLRLLRFFRLVSGLYTLRLIMAMVSASLASLAWALGFLLLFCYMFAIFAMQALSRHALREDSTSLEWNESTSTYYSSVGLSILTLLGSLSGGHDYLDVANPLLDVSIWYLVYFVAFIFFVQVGLMNIVVAVFVESTKNVAAIDAELVAEHEQASSEALAHALKKTFQRKKDKTKQADVLSENDLEDYLGNRRVVAHLKAMDVTRNDAKGVFNLCQKNSDGKVTVEQFVLGLLNLRGAAKSVDVVSVLHENRAALLENRKSAQRAERRYVKVQEDLLAARTETQKLIELVEQQVTSATASSSLGTFSNTLGTSRGRVVRKGSTRERASKASLRFEEVQPSVCELQSSRSPDPIW